MATLHLVYRSAGRDACRTYAVPGDCVILLGAAAQDPTWLATLAHGVRLCAIATAPGEPTPPEAQRIDYGVFVALAVSHDRVVSWD